SSRRCEDGLTDSNSLGFAYVPHSVGPKKNRVMFLHPSCVLPIKGRSGSEPFPSTGKGWIGVTVTFITFASSMPCNRESTAVPSPAHEAVPPSSWEPHRPFGLPGQPQSRPEPPPSEGRLTPEGERRTRRGVPESFRPARGRRQGSWNPSHAGRRRRPR